MSIFNDIFGRHPKETGDRQNASASMSRTADGNDRVDARPPVVIDDAIIALDQALSGLNNVQVPQAAKERGWAALQRELERRPVRPAVAPSRATGRGPIKRLRWALGSAAAAVAVVVTLLATLSGGGALLTVDNGDRPTTVPTVVSSDTSLSGTTVSTDGVIDTTVSTAVPGTDAPSTTGGTVPGTSTTSGSNTGTTSGSSGGGNPTTTQPASPGTTSDQQYAAAQRVGSAKAAALFLADQVITGNVSTARALVSPSAQSSLVQMMASLEEPYGYTFIEAEALDGSIVRVTFTINDRIVNSQGEVVETVKSFAVRVRVDDAGAVIIRIGAGA